MIEVIVSLGLIGIVIIPVFSVFILCQRIVSISNQDYEAVQTAQYYMEEIKARDGIDRGRYSYNGEKMIYERFVTNDSGNLSLEIRIKPDVYGLHYIEIDILREGEVVDRLEGSVVFE